MRSEAAHEAEELERDYRTAFALLDRSAALRHAATVARRRCGVDVAFVGEAVDDVDTLLLSSFSGNRSSALERLMVPAGTGLGGKVAVLRRPIWTSNYIQATTITHDFDVPVQTEGLAGMLAAPIVWGHRLVGVLYLATRSPTDFGDRVAGLAADLARQAGLAVGVADQAREMAALAVHEDRSRLAASLHDSVGATLFSIGAAVRNLRTAAPPDLLDKLAYIEKQTAVATVTLRQALRAMTEQPDDLALGVAMQADCRALQERSGIQATVVVLEDLPELDSGRISALLQVEREALLNVEKHASAGSVAVTVHRVEGGVAVVISDDGVGLGYAKGDAGIGMAASSERVERVGGHLTVTNNEDGGCTVRAWVPCQQ